jgi:RNA recognition motif-containing protein
MNIFVGGLPFKVDERELREIFEKYGELNFRKTDH